MDPQRLEQLREFFPDAPILGSRLAEIGMHPVSPWIWIQTARPIDRRVPTLTYISANIPTLMGRTLFREPQEALPGLDEFGPEWQGHHYEAIGVLRRFVHSGYHFLAPPDGLPGQPQMWIARTVEGAEPAAEIEAALWWQRAYRPTKAGSEPALVAELRWWPGLIGSQPFFRATTEVDHLIDASALRAAERARALLHGLQPKLDQGGRPSDSGDYDEVSEPRFFEDLGVAAHAAVRAGENLSYASLARHGLTGDRRTVKKYIERFDYDLPKIEAEAVKCTRRLVICQFHVRRMAEFKKNKG